MTSKIFKAKVIGASGSEFLTISANSQEQAAELAQTQGKLVYCKRELELLPTRPLNSVEREQLLSQLSFLTGSGVGAGQALQIVQENSTGRTRDVAAELLSSIERGSTLAEALGETSKNDFPSAIRALVWSGYRAGAGAEALASAGKFECELRELGESSNSGLMSAAFGFVGAAVATLVSVFYMGPEILSSTLVASAGDAVSVDWAMNMGYVLGTVMALMIIVTLGFVFNHFGLRKVFPLQADALTLKVPLWRNIALGQERYLSMFSVSALLSQHIELEKAFETAIEGMPDGLYKEEIRKASYAVKHGLPWVEEFTLLENLDKAALKGASNRKQLAQIFSKIALLSKDRYASSRKSLAITLQSIAALCLVTAGGLLFALTTLPLLQSASAIF